MTLDQDAETFIAQISLFMVTRLKNIIKSLIVFILTTRVSRSISFSKDGITLTGSMTKPFFIMQPPKVELVKALRDRTQ